MNREFQDIQVHFWNRITLKEKALFYEHLANLIDGGVTLIEALDSFCDKTKNPRFYRDTAELLFLIESGDVMSNAMKKLPRTFERGEISIVEAGEQSGTMQRSFNSLAEDLRNREDLRQKLISAMTYPSVILGFLVLAIAIIMVFVVPKLLPLFETASMELPFATRSLVATSEFVSNNFILIFLTIILGVVGFYTYIQSYNGKRWFDGCILRIPLIGNVYRNYLIVRISTTLGLLLGAGIPIIKTLKLTGESTNHLIYEEAIQAVADNVAKGNKITESLIQANSEKHELFPQDFIQLIGAGEKTSTINKICTKISAQYTREVDTAVAMLVKFVEPLAVLISGAFVLWFAFAIFSAVLKITETVG